MLGPRTKYVPNSMWPFAILHYGAISGEFKYSSISIILHAVSEFNQICQQEKPHHRNVQLWAYVLYSLL